MKPSKKILIQKMKNFIYNEDLFVEKCKKYNQKPSIIFDMRVDFADMPVSAKTVDGDILLNEQMYEKYIDGEKDIFFLLRYLIHEAIHHLQQKQPDFKEEREQHLKDMRGEEDGEKYLLDPMEMEAFSTQIDFQEKYEDPEKIQEYLEQLLDHHDIEGKEREEIKGGLLDG